jgi:hypothetical protein
MYFPSEIFEIIKEYFITEYYKLREYVSQNPQEIYEYFNNNVNDEYINFTNRYSYKKNLDII